MNSPTGIPARLSRFPRGVAALSVVALGLLLMVTVCGGDWRPSIPRTSGLWYAFLVDGKPLGRLPSRTDCISESPVEGAHEWNYERWIPTFCAEDVCESGGVKPATISSRRSAGSPASSPGTTSGDHQSSEGCGASSYVRFVSYEASDNLPEAGENAFPEKALSDVRRLLGGRPGLCAVLGDAPATGVKAVLKLAEETQAQIFFQSPVEEVVQAVRPEAERRNLLGTRVFVDRGPYDRIHLADNLADAVIVLSSGQTAGAVPSEDELLRVIRPHGFAFLASQSLTKPTPEGVDWWTHPYHRADNNPLSTDKLARWPYRTQFLAEPLFVPMPEVSVAAGGKVYRAFGHIAHKANQNAMLNTLLCINAFNGTILWRRPLRENFMIHRNSMVATPEALYLADSESCKKLDPETGEVLDEIVIPEGVADGKIWKWMALEEGTLYALVGGPEVNCPTQPSDTPGLGHWPWGMWPGHDYADPKTNFAFGRTFLAIDPTTKQILWRHHEDEYIDGRGVCMNSRHIFFFVPEKLLAALDRTTGQVAWRTSDPELLGVIGPNGRAQLWETGYATSVYLKCTEDMLFFAGPQRSRLVVISAKDGKLLWHRQPGNYQLVLHRKAIYAVGPQTADEGCLLDYLTGQKIGHLHSRRACTRATGTMDSIFYRAAEGTIRVDLATHTTQHIAPMRPPCQDGVIVSDGHLFWGPWMCGCQLSLYGHICLAPADPRESTSGANAPQREVFGTPVDSGAGFDVRPGDWPTYCGDNRRSCVAKVDIPQQVQPAWVFQPPSAVMPTAPVIAGSTVFVGDRAGVLRALDAHSGQLRWKAYTGSAIFFPPGVESGRVFVGSADGRVYAFEAASGRKLWSYRVAPGRRWIPVYGKLMSSWPVAGGVVVQDGVVYAAAGITHYDGTYVVALDARSGEPRWVNARTGVLSQTAQSGISLQGELFIEQGELRFLGGGLYELARFDLATGQCLNEPNHRPGSQYHTAFYAYYPDYGKYLGIDYPVAGGRTLRYEVTYEGSVHWPVALLEALPPGVKEPQLPISRWPPQRPSVQRKAVWQDKENHRFRAWILSPEIVVGAAEQPATNPPRHFLVAFRVSDGSAVWSRTVPAGVVKGGLAIDQDQRIVAALEDGRIVCLDPQKP